MVKERNGLEVSKTERQLIIRNLNGFSVLTSCNPSIKTPIRKKVASDCRAHSLSRSGVQQRLHLSLGVAKEQGSSRGPSRGPKKGKWGVKWGWVEADATLSTDSPAALPRSTIEEKEREMGVARDSQSYQIHSCLAVADFDAHGRRQMRRLRIHRRAHLPFPSP